MVKSLLSRLYRQGWRLLLDEHAVRVQFWSPDGWREEGAIAVPPINSAGHASGQDGIASHWQTLRDILPPACDLALSIQAETAEPQALLWPKLRRREWAPFLQQRFSRQLMAGDLVAIGAHAKPGLSRHRHSGQAGQALSNLASSRQSFAPSPQPLTSQPYGGGGASAAGGRDVWLLRNLAYLPELLTLLQADGHRLAKIELAGRDDAAPIALWLPIAAAWQGLSQQWRWWRRSCWSGGLAMVVATILLLLNGVQLRQEAVAIQAKATANQQAIGQLADQMPMPLAESQAWQLADRWWQQQVANHPPLVAWLGAVSARWPSALTVEKLTWRAGASKLEQWWQPQAGTQAGIQAGTQAGNLGKNDQPELQLQLPANQVEDAALASIIAMLPSQLEEGEGSPQPAFSASWQSATNGGQILTLQAVQPTKAKPAPKPAQKMKGG